MRTGDTQSVPNATPSMYLEIQTPVPEDVSAEVIRFHLDEQLYGGLYEFWLDNADSSFAAKSYEGYKVDFQIGFTGGTLSAYPDLWVDKQSFESIEGKLVMKLSCIDAWGLLARVRTTVGAQYWNYPEQATGTVEGDSVIPAGRYGAGATIAATYSGKTIENIVTFLVQNSLDITYAIDDDDLETYFNTLTPPMMVTNARQGIFDAMSMTDAYLVYKNDEDFHVIKASDHASVYTFALGSNQLWQDSQQSSILIPNRFIYHGRTAAGADLNSTTGDATRGVDATSYTRLGLYIDEHFFYDKSEVDLISDQTLLNSLAVSTLLKKQGEASQGTLFAPMHCSLELLDKITITDTRYSGTKTITGYAHRLVRDYVANKGIYRIEVTLGGAASGYTAPSGKAIVQKADAPIPPRMTPNVDTWQLPEAVQGYVHDIVFSATDNDTIAWSAGTVTFYDGSTQAIASGNTGNLADTDLRYVYFDLDDASPNVLKVQKIADYISTYLSSRTGIVCLIRKSSAADINAAFLPSYGKEPLITADWIHLGGLTMDRLADGTTYQRILATDLAAGHIKLTTNTTAEGKWYSSSGVSIDSTVGINIWGTANALTTRATEAGAIQCYVGADGKFYAGGGKVSLDANGIAIDNATGTSFLNFIYGANQAQIFVSSDGSLNFSPTSGTFIKCNDHVQLTSAKFFGLIAAVANGTVVWYDNGGTYDHSFLPETTDHGYLGSLAKRWKGIYATDLFLTADGTDYGDIYSDNDGNIILLPDATGNKVISLGNLQVPVSSYFGLMGAGADGTLFFADTAGAYSHAFSPETTENDYLGDSTHLWGKTYVLTSYVKDKIDHSQGTHKAGDIGDATHAFGILHCDDVSMYSPKMVGKALDKLISIKFLPSGELDHTTIAPDIERPNSGISSSQLMSIFLSSIQELVERVKVLESK